MGAIFLGVLLIGVVLCTNFVQRADDAINKEFGLDPRTFGIAAITVGILYWLLYSLR
jgi:hypothetical protein